jgi:integrase
MTNKMPLPSGITLTTSGKFHVDKQHNGKRYVQTCDSLALAELFVAQVKAGVITVSSTAEDSAAPMTVREVMNRYVDYRVDTSKSDGARPRQYNSYANALIAHFGADTFLDAITMPMQKALFDDMLSKYSASHINGTSSFLHGAMTYAYERGGMTNKPQRMGHVKVAEGRKRYLSDVEDQCAENWFYDNAPDFVALYHFYMDTGCRKSEAFQLEWADIDFQSNRITFWGNRKPLPMLM